MRGVDRFENKWHPRARNAIRRFVAAEHRDAFEEAFFRDMPQQPEGPLAVDSVKKLLLPMATKRVILGISAGDDRWCRRGVRSAGV